MYEFKLPDLGEGIHEGEILKWHVKTGDTIKADDPLVDVETDKAAVTIPSPRGGTIASISGEVGKAVPVGHIIAVIDDGAAAAPAAAKKPGAKPEARSPAKPEAATAKGKAPAKGEKSPAAEKAATTREQAPPAKEKGSPARATSAGAALDRPVVAAPATRRLARELGIDIRQVQASGPGGRVTSEDVETFARDGGAGARARGEEELEEAPSGSGAVPGAASGIPFLDLQPLPNFEQWGPVEKVPLRSIRRKVARKMTTSMILVPHVAHMDEADVTGLESFRRRERERREEQPGGKLTLLPFVMKAVAVGLKEWPQFNASLDPFSEEIIYKKYYNIGFAADTGKGLIVPVVRDVDQKTVLQISADIIALAEKAREDKLEVNDLRGGTFTITNVGAIGGFGAMPTINYPEVAILAMGRAQEKPVVRDGQIVIRTILPVTLTYDHRVIDGADAARFTNKLVERLSDTNLLLLEM